MSKQGFPSGRKPEVVDAETVAPQPINAEKWNKKIIASQKELQEYAKGLKDQLRAAEEEIAAHDAAIKMLAIMQRNPTCEEGMKND